MTFTLTKIEAQEVVSDDSEAWEVVEEIDRGSGRWSAHKEAIFSPRGKKEEGPWYSVTYSHGLTEQQDEAPFEYEDIITPTQVFPVAVQKIVWAKQAATIEGKTN